MQRPQARKTSGPPAEKTSISRQASCCGIKVSMIKEFSHYRPENVKMWSASGSYKTEAAKLYGVEIIV
jgi:hypothetical protein